MSCYKKCDYCSKETCSLKSEIKQPKKDDKDFTTCNTCNAYIMPKKVFS